jgi:hypothetical protein
MQRIVPIAAMAAFGALLLASDPVAAEPLYRDALAQAAGASGPSAQNWTKRARPQVNVHPRYPYRTYHSLYLLPYAVEYPGPNAQRECVARYVTEHRPSGTVIVPRMRCWWVRR